MSKKIQSPLVGVLLGTVSGCAACSLLALAFFPSHVVLAAVIGAIVGAFVGFDAEYIFEAAVACLISGVLVAMLVYGFLNSKTPSASRELVVVILACVLLGVGVGKLGASLSRGL